MGRGRARADGHDERLALLWRHGVEDDAPELVGQVSKVVVAPRGLCGNQSGLIPILLPRSTCELLVRVGEHLAADVPELIVILTREVGNLSAPR